MPEVEISREVFEAYRTVQKSGITNMFDAPRVIALAKEMCDVDITRKEIERIMVNYGILKSTYEEDD